MKLTDVVKRILLAFFIIMCFIGFKAIVFHLWDENCAEIARISETAEVEALGCDYCEKIRTLQTLLEKQNKLLEKRNKLLEKQNKILEKK